MNHPHTPMMQQYLEIKQQFPDTLVLYRMGDFYELFYNDAQKASKILHLTLTHRGQSAGQPVPMAGIPQHALETYLEKILRLGESAVICEQIGQTTPGKGLMQREITRIITPGTITDESLLDAQRDQVLLAILKNQKNHYALAWLDVTAGICQAIELDNQSDLYAQIFKLQPQEILLPSTLNMQFNCTITVKPLHYFNAKLAQKYLIEYPSTHLSQDLLKTIGCLFQYLEETYRQQIPHITKFELIQTHNYLQLDANTQMHLDILKNQQGTQDFTLIQLLDTTQTTFGSRLLKRWLLMPLLNPEHIQQRLDCVEYFIQHGYSKLRDLLKDMYDIERIASRIHLGNSKPRELIQLGNSLKLIPQIRHSLTLSLLTPALQKLLTQLQPCPELITYIEHAIVPNPPVWLKDGGVIAVGFDSELDELRAIQTHAEQYLLQLEQQAQQHTGCNNLRLGFNKIQGYYFEVSRSQAQNLSQKLIRKQTLKNSERFTTLELSEFENKLLSAESKALQREKHLYTEILHKIAAHIPTLRQLAVTLAELDVLTTLAERANHLNWTKPRFTEQALLSIQQGQHPIVAAHQAQKFIANDLELNSDQHLWLITGPNMGGKSTFMRQNALIVLLAHIGSYVPAQQVVLGPIDKIFTRIGASDQLAKGQSTFMVEMNEMSNIIQHATQHSLVLIDEIGRGTSTHDGVALAHACAIHLATKIKAFTLFSTHYFELTELENQYPMIKNMHMHVMTAASDIIFLYQMRAGAIQDSYGLEVAARAGLPDELIQNAKKHLSHLQKNIPTFIPPTKPNRQDSKLFTLIQQLNPDECSPQQALAILYQLKQWSIEDTCELSQN